jgi:hypothetical protein
MSWIAGLPAELRLRGVRSVVHFDSRITISGSANQALSFAPPHKRYTMQSSRGHALTSSGLMLPSVIAGRAASGRRVPRRPAPHCLPCWGQAPITTGTAITLHRHPLGLCCANYRPLGEERTCRIVALVVIRYLKARAVRVQCVMVTSHTVTMDTTNSGRVTKKRMQKPNGERERTFRRRLKNVSLQACLCLRGLSEK